MVLSAPPRWYLNRARAMSPRELAWRATAALPIRRRRTVVDPPDWEAEPWRSFLGEMIAARGEDLGAEAERIAAGELSFWGRRSCIDPSSPRWDRDPLSGSAPQGEGRDWSRDVKPLLELHRQQHLPVLAAAASVCGRDDWSELCAAQILDWIAHNPPGSGAGWESGYEAAHRLVGWAWSVPLIAHGLSPEHRALIAASYAAQVELTASRPSRYSSANNHRLGELVGLLAAELLGAGAVGWQPLWRELEAEATGQTYTDGGSREQGSGYFLYVLEILWLAGIMARGSGRGLGRIEERLAAMLGWLERVADEDGEPPPFGDDAEDRIIRHPYFEPRRARVIAGRVRSLLAGRPSFEGSGEVRMSDRSAVLPESGIAVFRSAASMPARVVTDVGELGLGSLAAHGHADALSVLLDAGGRTLLRDSGTYSYSPAEGRDEFRGTAAHSTVTVDGLGQAEIRGPHLWGRRFTTTIHAYALEPDLDYVRASHDGFRRHRAGAVHARSVAYLKPDLLIVLDRITAERACTATLAWQLPPGEAPERLGDGIATMGLASWPAAAPILQPVRFSPRYRTEVTAPRLTCAALGSEIVFATAVAFGAPKTPAVRLSHAEGVTTLVVTEPRPLRISERWRGEGISVQS